MQEQELHRILSEQFQRSFAFIKRNLHHVQNNRGFNTLGELEIPPEAIEELLVNALMHRDYFDSASIRVLVFRDRIEIISPGHLPGNLSTHDIQQGKTKRRNPVLSEHAAHLLPFRGLGSGIHRALQAWPQIELQDHKNGNEFKAVIARPKPPTQVISPSGIGSYSATDPVSPPVSPPVTGQVTGQVSQELKALLPVLQDEMSRMEIMEALALAGRDNFRKLYLNPALEAGLIEMTIPDKPNSRMQRYRLTPSGQQQVQQLKTSNKP